MTGSAIKEAEIGQRNSVGISVFEGELLLDFEEEEEDGDRDREILHLDLPGRDSRRERLLSLLSWFEWRTMSLMIGRWISIKDWVFQSGESRIVVEEEEEDKP